VADRLNLTIEGCDMTIDVGKTATATIAPTAAGGVAAPVTQVVFGVLPPGAYSITSISPLSARYTAVTPGATGIVATVSAVNSEGTILTEAQALPDITAATTPVAIDLNLTVAVDP
jgi:hypothetical protein